jgi:hypothetical protein
MRTYYDKDGKETESEEKAVASEFHKTKDVYKVRILRGRIYNPDNTGIISRDIGKWSVVSPECFKYYLRFLETRGMGMLNNAERARN